MALKEDRGGIHVLMVAFSSQGHINPMLRFGKRLISKGLNVSLATTEYARHRMLKSSTISASTDDISINGVQLLFFSDGLSLDHDRKANLDHYMETLGKFGPIYLSKLIEEHYPINGPKKLCRIINNPFVPWAIDVAEKHGIPCSMLWIQPCSLYAIYYRFYNGLNSFPTLANPEMSVELPGLPLLHTQDLPSFVLPSNPFGSFPRLFSEMFQSMKNYNRVLGNSFFELEEDAIDSMSELCPILPVGPLVPPSLLGENEQDHETGVEMWKAEDACLEWLNNQAPSSVVYISFGSIVVLQAKQMDSIAKALKNSGRSFIWVVKQPDVPSTDGAGQLPPGFLEETQNQGLVVSWSPQAKVLVHQAIACFITHCGWNSMLETIVAGVPVIAHPQWTDQPTNAKLVVDVFRIGLRLRPNQDGIVSNEEIERCIREVMEGPKSQELRSNAKELKRAAREAVADGGSSDRNIQVFIDEIIGNGIQDDPTIFEPEK
uniref:Glycosyltransferase n=1 Tax=Rhizophora mucronata TaxID=61149 RepID=A0A2P2P7X7_RHIMU